MKVKDLTLKVISFDELSTAIKDELGFLDIESDTHQPVSYGDCFLVHPPKTIEELEAQPCWADLCKQEDFKATETILVQVPFNKKIKKKNEHKRTIR